MNGLGVILVGTLVLSAGCRSKDDPGASLPACSDADKFGTLPVPLASIHHTAPIGIMAPVGGSPLPKRHTGILLALTGVPVVAPGRLLLHRIRETTYLSSPTRPGYSDYALFFSVCAQVEGHFGHLSSLAPDLLARLNRPRCSEYSTVDERVRICEYTASLTLSEGSPLGTAGAAPHSPVLDMGMEDSRVADYVNPGRYGSPRKGTLCPWDWFQEGGRSALYARLGNGATVSTESPQCGSMAVDQAGTAKGRWTLASAPASGTDPTASDFFVLAPDPYASQTKVVISTRVSSLAPGSLPTFSVNSGSRINPPPSSVTPDGQVYCYVPDHASSTYSFFVQMLSAGTLKAEKITHAAGSSPCSLSPASWAFSGAAVELIR